LTSTKTTRVTASLSSPSNTTKSTGFPKKRASLGLQRHFAADQRGTTPEPNESHEDAQREADRSDEEVRRERTRHLVHGMRAYTAELLRERLRDGDRVASRSATEAP
jgi:hypothetical protein